MKLSKAEWLTLPFGITAVPMLMSLDYTLQWISLVLFSVCNLLTATALLKKKNYGFSAMQIYFLLFNIYGIWNRLQ